jgi:hypothetical protein
MYPAVAVYSKVDSLSCSNVPCSGFCTMPELAITPSILRGKRQAPPDATLKTPVELMPQVDSIPATGHSEAARADETAPKPGPARTTAKAIAFDTRMKNLPVPFSTVTGSRFPGVALIWIKEASGQTRTSRPTGASLLCRQLCCTGRRLQGLVVTRPRGIFLAVASMASSLVSYRTLPLATRNRPTSSPASPFHVFLLPLRSSSPFRG